jgi:hypothetical protein
LKETAPGKGRGETDLKVTKEKQKVSKKVIDFFPGLCYYNTRSKKKRGKRK